MRLFFAIDLPKEIKQQLHELAWEFKDFMHVPKLENIHLTVLFLGEQSNYTFNVMVDKMRAQFSFPHFSLSLRGVGFFPSRDFVRVVWVGVDEGKRAVEKLHEHVCNVVGVKDQRFHPHVTIGRVKRRVNVSSVEAALKDKVWGPFVVRRLYLVESRLQRFHHPIYEVKEVFELD
jgi:2'-5' RNA ligase